MKVCGYKQHPLDMFALPVPLILKLQHPWSPSPELPKPNSARAASLASLSYVLPMYPLLSLH